MIPSATAVLLIGFQHEQEILDASMPGMSGIEVCRARREDAHTAGCTILVLRGNSDADQKIEAFSGGADDSIVKPFSPRDLVGRVRAALRLQGSSGQARAPDSPGPSRRAPA